MCGRYTVSKTKEVLADHLGIEVSRDVRVPTYNASPGQQLPAVLNVEPRQIQPVLWGIKPKWTPKQSRLLINARAETVHQRPTFRDSFRKRRCLVIADGFYEWQLTKAGKQPFRITLATGKLFAFAAIWEEVNGERAYVILTTDANSVTRPIHGRMPVILEPREYEPWLNDDLAIEAVQALLDPYPENEMTAYKVSKAVNNSKNEGPTLITPLV